MAGPQERARILQILNMPRERTGVAVWIVGVSLRSRWPPRSIVIVPEQGLTFLWVMLSHHDPRVAGSATRRGVGSCSSFRSFRLPMSSHKFVRPQQVSRASMWGSVLISLAAVPGAYGGSYMRQMIEQHLRDGKRVAVPFCRGFPQVNDLVTIMVPCFPLCFEDGGFDHGPGEWQPGQQHCCCQFADHPAGRCRTLLQRNLATSPLHVDAIPACLNAILITHEHSDHILWAQCPRQETANPCVSYRIYSACVPARDARQPGEQNSPGARRKL